MSKEGEDGSENDRRNQTRDIAWARSFGVGVLTDMPEKPQKGAARSRKAPAGTPEGAEAVARAGGQFGEAA